MAFPGGLATGRLGKGLFAGVLRKKVHRAEARRKEGFHEGGEGHEVWDERVAPIPGTTSPQRLRENCGAASVEFSPEDLRELESVSSGINVQGARYPENLRIWSDGDWHHTRDI